jgi:parvulin-like peptidyl-prolyl isomerase
MAKRKEEEIREETKKQAHRRRRDEEANRKVMYGLIAVGAVLLLIILAGVIQELVLKPRQPVATVNDQLISLQDYQKQVRFKWFQELQQNQTISDAQGSATQVLDQMVDVALLREQAAQRGITVTEQEINEQVEKAFGFYRQTPTPFPTSTTDPNASPTPAPTGTIAPTSTPAPTATPVTEQSYLAEYKRYMDTVKAGSELTEADWRKLVEADLLQQKLFEDVTKDVPTTGEQVRLRHILIAIRTPEPTPEPTATPGADATALPTVAPDAAATPTPQPTLAPRTDAEALQLAQEIEQKLASGEDFAALAATYSDDTGSAKEGGELGWYSKGEGLVQEFEDVALSLAVGAISDPVKTQFGYHIIQVEEKDPNRELNAYTVYQKQQEAFDAWLTNLRNAAKVVRNWTLDKVPPTPSVRG